MSIIDINEAASLRMKAHESSVNIIFGAGIDDSLDDEVRITVIATGFEKTPFPKKEDTKSKNSGERDWTRSFSNGNSGSTYGPSGRQDFSSGSSYEDMSFNMPRWRTNPCTATSAAVRWEARPFPLPRPCRP